MNPLLAELTVIVPTLNRPIAAEAVASQWARKVGHMIIVDGSERPNSVAFERFPNVTYIHDRRSIEVRLGRASELVATRFAMLQSDDDVFIPGSIAACVSELDRSNAYIAISSTAANAIGRQLVGLSYADAIGWNNNSPSRAARLQYLGSHYTPSCIYGVCRTEALQASFLAMATGQVPVYAFAELHHEFFVNGVGAVKVLPVIGWIRRDSYESTDTREKGEARKWFADAKGEYRKLFVQGVSSALSEATASSLTEVLEDVELGLTAYAELVLASWAQSQSRLHRILRICKQLIPRFLRRVIKNCRKRYKHYVRSRSADLDFKSLAGQGIELPEDAIELLHNRIDLEQDLADGRT